MGLTFSDSKPGLITEVKKDSIAEKKELKKDDRILKIGQHHIKKTSDILDALRQAQKLDKERLLLFIEYGKQRRFITLPLKKT